MEEALSKMFQVVSDPYTYLTQEKERSKKKIIGCFPMHLPLEMVHASGALPVNFWRSNEPVTLGHSHVYSFNCSITRSVVDDAVKGKLAFMDGMLFNDICLQGRELPFLMGRNAPPSFLHVVYLPGPIVGQVYKDFLMESLVKLKKALEEFCQRQITNEGLSRSIALYNKSRHLLRRLYELRRQNPGLMRAKEMVAILQAGTIMPKEEHNSLLEQLLQAFPKRTAPANSRPKVLPVGCLCQAPRFDFLDVIEEVGAVVVDDDLYMGSRSIIHDVAPGGDPIEALAMRYLQRVPPCPTKVDWETIWGDYIVERVRQVGAQGVITMLVKFCPPHLCYYPDQKRALAVASIPEVLMEVEHEVVSLEPLKTRLQAFVEGMRR